MSDLNSSVSQIDPSLVLYWSIFSELTTLFDSVFHLLIYHITYPSPF